MDVYDSALARIVERGGMVVALGGLDSGKTTFCTMCAAVAVRLGKRVAYLDTDIGQTSVGPPTTIGLKFLESDEQLQPEQLARADARYFVGATSPAGHLLPMVVGATKMVAEARREDPHLIVVDTTGLIDGTLGQVLKLYKVEAMRPDWVIGFQRGGELEPILGSIRRALPPEVECLPVDGKIVPTSIEQRAQHRLDRLRAVFEPPLQRWKVKPSVLVPPVPPEVDPADLDGLLVGMDDGKGNCIGLGILEHKEDGLRMISSVTEGAKALRLGSVRVQLPEFRTTSVDLRHLFLSD